MNKIVFMLKVVCCFIVAVIMVSCNEETIEPQGEGSITGVVLGSESDKPIVAVSITTNPATSAIITDAEGKFTIDAISGGSYSISAKKTGYKSETVNIAVKDGKQTTVTILMEKTKDGNSAPKPATNPEPVADAENVSNSVILKWKGNDPDRKDTLSYDVYLFESGSLPKKKIAESIKDTSLVVNDLKYNTTYFWQVITKDASDNITNGDVWSFKTYEFPNLRFLLSREVDGNHDVYISDGTEKNTLKLTTNFAREWWPRLNPQRDVIAYSSNAGIDPQIYTMNRDGTNKRQVTTLPVVGYHNQGIGFAWSPDGGKLLYANYDKLYTVNKDGSNLQLIAIAPGNRHFRMVDWTDQGDKIIAQTIGTNINDSELYIMNSDGSNLTLIVGNISGRVESPIFSLDGKSILYTHDASGFENAEGRQLDARIYLKRLDGSSLVDLSAHKPAGTNDLFPRFSPDGSKVIFMNTSNDGISQKDIWIVEVKDPKSRTKIFSNAEMPEWK